MQLFLVCLCLFSTSCLFHPRNGIDGYKYALRHGAPFKVRLRVVTPEGEPVKGAVVRLDNTTALSAFGAFMDRHRKTEYTTDANGECVLSGSTVGEYWFTIHKDGFYRHKEDVWLRRSLPKEECVRDGRWQPYDAVKEIIYKPIRHPIPMYYLHPRKRSFPAKDFPVGLQFETGKYILSWTPPQKADLLINVDLTTNPPNDIQLAANEICVHWCLFFPNKGDGIVERPAQPTSNLLSDYHAGQAWNFVPEIHFYMIYNQAGQLQRERSIIMPRVGIENKYYALRIRTQIDNDGNVISANYAKLYILGTKYDHGCCTAFLTNGNLIHSINLAYFYNPVANDPNLECDRKQQLGSWKNMDHLSWYWH